MFLGIEFTQAYLIVYGLLMSLIVTGLFGILLTLPTLRLREDYLAIVTIVAGEIVRQVLNNQAELGGFIGYRPGNPVYEQYNPRIIMRGLYLTSGLLILVLLVIGVSHAILVNHLKRKKIGESDSRSLQKGIQRSITFATLAFIIIIFLDYFKLDRFPFEGEPSLGLHIALITLIVSLIFGKIRYSKRIHYVFGLNYTLSIISFLISGNNPFPDSTNQLELIGWNLDVINWASGTSEINIVNWFTMIFAFLSLLGVFVILQELYYSPFGRTLRAIREDDTSAISVGKSIFDYRLRALIIASSLCGFVGAMYAQFLAIVTPASYMPLLTFKLYIIMIIGGTGNNKGVIFGGVVIMLLERVTKGTLFQDANLAYPNGDRVDMVNIGLIFMGVMFIIFLIYSPGGIFPEVKQDNQRYYDLLHYTEEERREDDLLLNTLVRLSKTKIESEEWISSE